MLAAHLVQDVSQRVRECVELHGDAVLALSGGSTPKKFLQLLAKQSLPWHKLIVTLVDERWCAETQAQSNAKLIKENLLQGEAAKAHFVPLYQEAATPLAGLQACEERLQAQLPRLDFALLGMGMDGHCASWFPHSAALPALLIERSSARVAPVLDAPNFPARMSLTWAFLRQAQLLYLHFEGAAKKSVWQQVQQDLAQTQQMPVRKILGQDTIPLHIYYSD